MRATAGEGDVSQATTPATTVPAIDIRPEQWAIVQAILRRHVPNREVWAFGSRARRTAKPYSDLDLAILGDEPLGLALSAALSDDFSESDLPWKVDVVDWAMTSESFRRIIEKDRVLLQTAGFSPAAPAPSRSCRA